MTDKAWPVWAVIVAVLVAFGVLSFLSGCTELPLHECPLVDSKGMPLSPQVVSVCAKVPQ